MGVEDVDRLPAEQLEAATGLEEEIAIATPAAVLEDEQAAIRPLADRETAIAAARQKVEASYASIVDEPEQTAADIATDEATSQEAGAEIVQEQFDTRAATREDIAAMVEIDIASFYKVYKAQGRTQDLQKLRSDITSMFERRFQLLGGELMPVAIRRSPDGSEEIVSFVHVFLTNHGPEDFASWEQTTSHGLLNDHDPHGRFMYVITLSKSPNLTEEAVQSMFVPRVRGLMIQHGCELMYFESRIPYLKPWVVRWCRMHDRRFDELTETEKADLALTYVNLEQRDRTSKQRLPRDPLLAMYVGMGNHMVRLVANAYDDEPSLHFGVVFAYTNPLPPEQRRGAEAQARADRLIRISRSLEQTEQLLYGG